MSKIIRKIVSVATSLTVAVMMVGPVPASAMTAAELQAAIADLQAQLAALTTQLATLEGGAAPAAGVPTACVGITFASNLAVGSSGANVKCLQALLNTAADTQVAASGVGSAGNETIYFGPLTKGAVIKFQEKYASEILASWGLTAGTGFVGSTTRAKLNSLLVAAPAEEEAAVEEEAVEEEAVEEEAVEEEAVEEEAVEEEAAEEEVVTGEGLAVALADDNPVAATVVADGTASTDSAQSMIPFLKLKLSNGDAAEVKVTTITFTRSGISADADLSAAYLTEGDTILAEYNSFSDAVLTFTNSAGIVTIAAGTSKTITLKADLTNYTNSGKTIRFSVAAATDVTSDASSLNGTFPLTGNYMSTAQATDVGQLTVTTSTQPSQTPDPQDNFDAFNFNLAGADQKLEVRKIKVYNIGSTAYTDLTNLKLYDGATQIGSTIAQMDSDKTITFDLTASPLVIGKGITKNMHVKADLVSGTNRTFQFSLQNMTDITVYDTQYGIFVKPNKSDTWTIFQHSASTIQTGKMTLTRASDSPSGNVAKAGTNVVIGKYSMKAQGEDIKITAMDVQVYGGVGTNDLYQGKVYFEGSQKGTTDTILDSGAAAGTSNSFSFGNTFIVPAGTTGTLEIKADIKYGTGADTYSGGETVTCRIASVTALGKTSSASVSVGVVDGYQLTIATGALSGAKNQAYGSWSAANPTAVKGATQALIGSFVITAGASEGADVTAIAAQWTTTTNDTIQNLKLYKGTKATGTQIGAVQSSVTAATDYTFYPDPYISLAASESFTLNVYADILTDAGDGDCGYVRVGTITGSGKVTNTSVNSSGTVTGQLSYISTGGTVDVSQDPSTSIAGLVVMGSTGVELAKLTYSASTSPENILITQIVATTTLTGSAPTSTISNINLVADGLNVTKASLAADGSATFDLSGSPWTIAAGTEKILTIKADIGSYAYASSGATVAIGVATTTYKGAMAGILTDVVKPAETAGNAMTTYKTKPAVSHTVASGTLTDGTHTILEFTITADAGANVNLYSVNLGVVLSDNATTSGDLGITVMSLYDKADLSTVLNSAVGTSTAAEYYTVTSTAVAESSFGPEIDTNTKSGDVKLYDDADYDGTRDTVALDVIPAGTSVTYVVKATITGSAQYDSIIARLNDLSTETKNAITWGDQIDVDIDSTYVKVLPTSYSTLSR